MTEPNLAEKQGMLHLDLIQCVVMTDELLRPKGHLSALRGLQATKIGASADSALLRGSDSRNCGCWFNSVIAVNE